MKRFNLQFHKFHEWLDLECVWLDTALWLARLDERGGSATLPGIPPRKTRKFRKDGQQDGQQDETVFTTSDSNLTNRLVRIARLWNGFSGNWKLETGNLKLETGKKCHQNAKAQQNSSLIGGVSKGGRISACQTTLL